jgi:acylphosphatase
MKTFGYNLKINKRKDGQVYILKMTKTQEVYRFLIEVNRTMNNCKSMRYKFDWKFRFNIEKEKVRMNFPNYEIIESDSSRYQNYTEEDIKKLIHLKLKGKTDKEIATCLNRTYWSVVYKFKDLRKNGFL